MKRSQESHHEMTIASPSGGGSIVISKSVLSKSWYVGMFPTSQLTIALPSEGRVDRHRSIVSQESPHEMTIALPSEGDDRHLNKCILKILVCWHVPNIPTDHRTVTAKRMGAIWWSSCLFVFGRCHVNSMVV
jgi:hypothetical protein